MRTEFWVANMYRHSSFQKSEDLISQCASETRRRERNTLSSFTLEELPWTCFLGGILSNEWRVDQELAVNIIKSTSSA